ncbi:hypothetical protein BY996DRAFT_6432490 [Phakopsora pachyrhizi]|nr:hypothetical protein BY996DRAFT_6432490 [Phakopsora pachyrhizi]
MTISQPTSESSNSTSGWDPSNLQNPGTNPRIPKSISSSCQAYLARLNSNSKLKTCTAPLLNATAAFSNGPQSIKSDQLKTSYDSLCHGGSGCEPSLIHAILGHLAGNCTQELQSGETTVRALYDVLYILTPYRVSMCSQDPSTGSYCPSVIASAVVRGTSDSKGSDRMMSSKDFGRMVSSVLSGDKLVTQLGPSNPSSSNLNRRGQSDSKEHSPLVKNLLKIANFSTTNQSGNNLSTSSSTQTANLNHPNPEAYTSTYLAFLFLNPDLPEKALCTPCTQAVLASYIGFEQASPYVGGLAASGYLSGQVKLWQSVSQKCGHQFMESVNTDAGIMYSMTDTSLGNSNRMGTLQSLLIYPLIVLVSFRMIFIF